MPKNFAATRPVNPPGVLPKITIEQLWAGIAKKARDPKGYVPNVVSSSVVEDLGYKIVREVVFRDERTGNESKVTEQITFNEPTCAIFLADTPEQKIYVVNLISFDKENNLQLTFSFVGGVPGQADPGSGVSVEELSQKAGLAVEKSIAKFRELVNEGLL